MPVWPLLFEVVLVVVVVVLGVVDAVGGAVVCAVATPSVAVSAQLMTEVISESLLMDFSFSLGSTGLDGKPSCRRCPPGCMG